MTTWLLVGGIVVACLVSAYVAVRAIRCNWRLLREARERAPLDGLDVSGATVAPVRTPDQWPEVSEVADPAVAAAYASLADDRALTGALVGELLVVGGGAALGAALPAVVGLERSGAAGLLLALPAAAMVLLPFAAVVRGLAYRAHATRRWDPVRARYLARHRELQALAAEPVADVPVPRRGRIAAWLGLRPRQPG